MVFLCWGLYFADLCRPWTDLEFLTLYLYYEDCKHMLPCPVYKVLELNQGWAVLGKHSPNWVAFPVLKAWRHHWTAILVWFLCCVVLICFVLVFWKECYFVALIMASRWRCLTSFSLLNIFLKVFFFNVYSMTTWLHVSVPFVCHVPTEAKRGMGSLELQFRTIVNCLLGTGKWTPVLWKSNLNLLCHLFSGLYFSNEILQCF